MIDVVHVREALDDVRQAFDTLVAEIASVLCELEKLGQQQACFERRVQEIERENDLLQEAQNSMGRQIIEQERVLKQYDMEVEMRHGD
jgi:predicted nuclease with TOPRIM domain